MNQFAERLEKKRAYNRENQRKYRQSEQCKAAYKRLYQQRKALNICVRCGREDAETGRVLCWRCRMNDRDRRVGILVSGEDSEGWARKREIARRQMIARHVALGHKLSSKKH